MYHTYSSIATHKECPRRYKYAYVDKLPRGDRHEAAVRGDDVHQSAEDYLAGKRDDVHIDILQHQGFFNQLRDAGAQPETKFAVDREWKPCSYDSSDRLIRGKIDIELADAQTIYELKTGKRYEEHMSQMNLYGLIKLIEWETDHVDVICFYLDQPLSYKTNPQKISYAKDMVGSYKYFWNLAIEEIENDQTYMANPTWKCKFCPYSRDNKGPCEF